MKLCHHEVQQMSQDHMHRVIDIYDIKYKITFTHNCIELSEYKFQHTRNAGKVKEKELCTCIIIQDYLEFYSNTTVSYYNMNGRILEIYVSCLS